MSSDPMNDPSTARTEVAMPAVAAPAKKVSRRRRVKLAPPPAQMEIDVNVWGENNFFADFDQNIDAGGLFISSLETLPVGHELGVTIAVDGKKFKCRAQVAFVRMDSFSNPECTQGAGLKLSDLTPDAKSAIHAFFKKRRPNFYRAGV